MALVPLRPPLCPSLCPHFRNHSWCLLWQGNPAGVHPARFERWGESVPASRELEKALKSAEPGRFRGSPGRTRPTFHPSLIQPWARRHEESWGDKVIDKVAQAKMRIGVHLLASLCLSHLTASRPSGSIVAV